MAKKTKDAHQILTFFFLSPKKKLCQCQKTKLIIFSNQFQTSPTSLFDSHQYFTSQKLKKSETTYPCTYIIQ